jgi:hypothetical protein
MTKTIKLSDEAYERLEQQVWEAVTDFDYLPSYFGKCIARTKSLHISIENPSSDSPRYIWKNFTKKQLVEVYLSMPDRTHCGACDVVLDPDACSPDLLMQHALFGEVVYG